MKISLNKRRETIKNVGINVNVNIQIDVAKVIIAIALVNNSEIYNRCGIRI